MAKWTYLAMILVVGICVPTVSAGYIPRGPRLSVNYYRRSCPRVEAIVTATTRRFVQADPTLAASIIRLFFHDCFVQGCDGSVLLDSLPLIPAEKDGAPNAGTLRGLDVIAAAKAALEQVCPATVSCADIVALAARDATVLAFGPFWRFPLGRRDGSTSLASNTLTELPAPFNNITIIAGLFQKKGLSIQDMVTLSGAHTVGRAHCAAISFRLYNFGGENITDPSIDPVFAQKLKQTCPRNSPGSFVALDAGSQFRFDSSYYRGIEANRGVLQSDQILKTGGRIVSSLVRSDQNMRSFFAQFPGAMIRMGNIGVLTGNQGEVRLMCNQTNPTLSGY